MNPNNILRSELCPPQHVISVVRDPCSGHVTDFVEQRLDPDITGTHCKNSSSMKRALAPPDSSFQGSTSNYPFWPGGFELPQVDISLDNDELDFSPEKLLHCPPGFEHGVDFYKLSREQGGSGESPDVLSNKNVDKVNLAEILDLNDAVLDMFKDENENQKNAIAEGTNKFIVSTSEDDSHISELQVNPQFKLI